MDSISRLRFYKRRGVVFDKHSLNDQFMNKTWPKKLNRENMMEVL